jgi:small subunit ribosomal protein S1
MTESLNVDFDWELAELEQNKTKRKLTSEELTKLGYDDNIIKLYNDTLGRLNFTPRKDLIVQGYITEIKGNTAIIDINYTEEAYLELNKEDSKYLDYIVEDSEITVKIVNEPQKKGYIQVSFSAAVEKMKYDEIFDSINKNVAFNGYVDSLLPGGYLVKIDGIDTFMPGSLAGVNKLYDFNILLGQEVLVKAVNFERNNIVVSHRDYLKTLIPGKIEQLREEKGVLLTGIVTGTTKYGVFCEFNDCLTGMILSSDLNEDLKERHSKNNIKAGESIEFYVKEIVSNKKIILTQFLKSDPWSDITERYQIPSTVKGNIISIKQYGAFIRIEDDVIGLLHQSEIENRNLTEGQEIDVSITRIDKSTKKVYLSLK